MPGKPEKRHPVTQPLDKSYRHIALTQGQNAIVDREDFDWLSQWNWSAKWDNNTHCFYAARRVGQTTITMHRVILGCSKKQQGDHKNNNPLDNRRENLRKCTGYQNRCNRKLQRNNTSGFKGVSWHKPTKKWNVQIGVRGHDKHIGLFTSIQEAARAYDAAAKKYYGEFARLNFPK